MGPPPRQTPLAYVSPLVGSCHLSLSRFLLQPLRVSECTAVLLCLCDAGASGLLSLSCFASYWERTSYLLTTTLRKASVSKASDYWLLIMYDLCLYITVLTQLLIKLVTLLLNALLHS